MWGEVLRIDGESMQAMVRPMYKEEEYIAFDYCIICCGAQIGAASAPWVRSSPETDERFLEGRRRRILAEHAQWKSTGPLRSERAPESGEHSDTASR